MSDLDTLAALRRRLESSLKRQESVVNSTRRELEAVRKAEIAASQPDLPLGSPKAK